MSPINYRLELPTQWSIHPVFHIDLLTLYWETIMHGANYQCPPPNLVDNTEEYKVEKILDSQLFGRRWQLQYLVKWKGYPDLDNMWVNKDDIFTDDKVQTFKEAHPDTRTHLRAVQLPYNPHLPLASSRSSSTSYYTPHIQSMSSDGRSNLAGKPWHTAHRESFTPPPGPWSAPPINAEIAKAIRLLRLSTPPLNSIKLAETTSILANLWPNTPFIRNADRHSLATRATPSGLEVTGSEERWVACHRDDSHHPDYKPDLRHCAQCDGPMEYCHRYDTADPLLVPSLLTPIFVWPPAAPDQELAHIHHTHANTAALAAQIARLICENNKDTVEVLAPLFVPTNERPAQGMGIWRGRHRGQVQGIAQPESVPPPQPPAYMCTAPTGAVAPLQPPEGFIHNVKVDFIPFTITNKHRVPTPAWFIQVHMTTDPYVIGHLTLNGTDYWAELHATPNDDKPVQVISDHVICMFNWDYPAANLINMVVGNISDQMLEAEIMRHCSMMAWLDVNQQQQKCLKLEQERLELNLGMCWQHLQVARACNQVLDDMVADQHIHWEQHRGCGHGCPAWKGDDVGDRHCKSLTHHWLCRSLE